MSEKLVLIGVVTGSDREGHTLGTFVYKFAGIFCAFSFINLYKKRKVNIIMFKKIAAIGAASTALLALTIPAFACRGSMCFLKSTTNVANVNTVTTASAYTGENSQSNITTVLTSDEVIALSGTGFGTRTMTSGSATADARSLTVANASNCGCTGSGCLTNVDTNRATVGATTGAIADTGLNAQDNDSLVDSSHEVITGSVALGGTSTLHSGAATSTSRGLTLVNVRWSR